MAKEDSGSPRQTRHLLKIRLPPAARSPWRHHARGLHGALREAETSTPVKNGVLLGVWHCSMMRTCPSPARKTRSCDPDQQSGNGCKGRHVEGSAELLNPDDGTMKPFPDHQIIPSSIVHRQSKLSGAVRGRPPCSRENSKMLSQRKSRRCLPVSGGQRRRMGEIRFDFEKARYNYLQSNPHCEQAAP